MKVIKEYPPNYDDIVAAIPEVADNKDVVFAYGDKIYAPRTKKKIPKDLRVHEEEHMRQQGDNPAGWWTRYLNDIEFRLSQEIEAYRSQYIYFVQKNHDINKRKKFLQGISKSLSGPLYGEIITQADAVRLLISIV